MENVVINITHPVRGKIVVGGIEMEEVQLQREVRVVIPPQSFDIREAIFRGKIINGYRMDHMRYERKILRRNTGELWEMNVFDTFDLRLLFNLPSLSQEEIRKAHGLEPMWDASEDDFKAAVGKIIPNFAQEEEEEEDDDNEGEEENNVN
ncbi:uncharacterized protein [Cardiocondyla obscurior]